VDVELEKARLERHEFVFHVKKEIPKKKNTWEQGEQDIIKKYETLVLNQVRAILYQSCFLC